MQPHIWQIASLAMIAIAGLAAYGDRRRIHRSDPDRVGFMPWTLVQVVALFAAAIAGTLALKGL